MIRYRAAENYLMTVFDTLKTVGKALTVLKVTERVTEMAGEPPQDEQPEERPTIIDEIEVEGRELVKRVRELIHEGNIRTLRIKDKNGKYLLELPLTMGVVTGGVFALTAPWAVALSALAGLVMDVKIEIIRDDDTEKKE
jgi:hypothetical protein